MNEYVIRRYATGNENQRAKYWYRIGDGEWMPCQRCALRYDRDAAHREHRGQPGWTVVRLVPRQA